MQIAPEKYFEFGEFRLEPDERRLTRQGERIPLAPKAFELLLLFVESGGRVIGREEIINRLWPDTAVEPANLKQLVYTLRKTLGDSSETHPIIRTLPKLGYRFLAPVRMVQNGGPDAETDTVVYTNVSVEQEVFEVEDEDDDDSFIDVTPSELGTGARAALPGATTYPRPHLFTRGLATIAIIAVAAAVYYFGFARKRPPLSAENLTLQRLTNTDNLYWAMLSPNGQFVVYVLLHEDGRQSLHLLEIATRSERTLVEPDAVAYYGGGFTPDSTRLYYDTWRSSDATGKCILYQIPLLGDVPRKVIENVAGPVSVSPDGKRIVFTRAERTKGMTHLMTANSADGTDEKVIASTPHEFDFIAPNWSPDGSRILFVSSEKRDDGYYWSVAETPANGGERRNITEPVKQRFWAALWLGDGSTILLNASSPDTKIGQLFTIDYSTGTVSRLTNDLNYYLGLSASSDGKKIIVTQGQRFDDVLVWPVNGSEPPRRITNRSVTIDSLTWSGDGHVIYNESENGKQTLWNINPDDRSRSRLTADEIQGLYPEVSADGQYILFRSNRSGSWQIWRMKSDGTDLRQITDNVVTTGRAMFAMGGSKIVFERRVDDADVLSMMDVNGGEMVDVSPRLIGIWTVSGDGTKIAYRYYDPDVQRTRTAVKSLQDPGRVSYLEIIPRDFLVFAPNGESILTKRPEPENDPMSTIWEFPIDGSQPRKYFSHPTDNILWASFSKDGKEMAIVQGRTTTNLVLFTRAD